MKKLNPKQKARLVRRSLWGNGRGKRPPKICPNLKIKFKDGRAVLEAPKHFNMTQHPNDVLGFLSTFRQLRLYRKRLLLDFTTIQTMSPMCALLVCSELDKWQRLGGKKLRVVDQEQWSPIVKTLLYQMGFNELLSPTDTFYAQSTDTDVKYLRLRSGTFGDAQIAEELATDLARMSGNLEHANLLHEGLTEAMINSKKWAYDHSTPDEDKLWWVTGSYQTSTRTATVMIYDHGQGIPVTVPVSGLKEFYKSVLEDWGIKKPNDAYWIQAAMTIGRTASGLKNRGKGLKDIQEFVLASDHGLLRVVSGNGNYQLDHSGKDTMNTLPKNLKGTLITWQVTLKEENDRAE